MCRPNTCDKCKKQSFKGCGQHLKTLFKDVKKENICQCTDVLKQFVKENKKEENK